MLPATILFLLFFGNAASAEASSSAAAQRPSQQPTLAMNDRQRDAVRAAAAAYRGIDVRVILQRPGPEDAAFARRLANALQSAGLKVSTMRVGTVATADCPDRPGLLVRYGTARSGAVNAVAEALIRSGVLSESVSGCPVGTPEELAFIVTGTGAVE